MTAKHTKRRARIVQRRAVSGTSAMMIVKVRVYHYEVFGDGLITLNLTDGAKVRDVLSKLVEEFGEEFEKKTGTRLDEAFESGFRIFFNELLLNLASDREHELNDGDELVLLRPVSGG